MKIHSPRQLLAVIPHMLGFSPDSSLVCIALVDEEIDVILRMDIAEAINTAEAISTADAINAAVAVEATEHVADLTHESGTKNHYTSKVVTPLAETLEKFRLNLASLSNPQVVVVAYATHDIGRTDLNTVEDELEGFEVLDLLLVTGTHWRSLMCEDASCCPEQGHELDLDIEDSAVQFVLQGSAPFESRQHMSDSLVPITLDQEQRGLQEEAFLAQIQIPTTVANRANVGQLCDVLARGSQLSWSEVAQVSVQLRDFHYRDALLRLLLDDAKVRLAVRSGLCDVLRRTQTRWVAPVATTLAGCAWLDGNGALARMAVDRALESDPEYSLARLLDRALTHGVPPRVWAESLAAVSFDECAQGAA